jgi:hypothetical protein
VIALLMPGILVGGVFAADALSDRPIVPIAVADGVTVTPPLDWEFVTRLDPQPDGTEGIVLTRGFASLIVYTIPLAPPEAVAALRDELTEGGMVSVGEVQPVDFRPDQAEQRFAFTGPMPELSATPVEGEATAIDGRTVTVVLMAWTGVGEYDIVRNEIERMILEATIP